MFEPHVPQSVPDIPAGSNPTVLPSSAGVATVRAHADVLSSLLSLDATLSSSIPFLSAFFSLPFSLDAM